MKVRLLWSIQSAIISNRPFPCLAIQRGWTQCASAIAAGKLSNFADGHSNCIKYLIRRTPLVASAYLSAWMMTITTVSTAAGIALFNCNTVYYEFIWLLLGPSKLSSERREWSEKNHRRNLQQFTIDVYLFRHGQMHAHPMQESEKTTEIAVTCQFLFITWYSCFSYAFQWRFVASAYVAVPACQPVVVFSSVYYIFSCILSHVYIYCFFFFYSFTFSAGAVFALRLDHSLILRPYARKYFFFRKQFLRSYGLVHLTH